jgi:hypothetical protein
MRFGGECLVAGAVSAIILSNSISHVEKTGMAVPVFNDHVPEYPYYLEQSKYKSHATQVSSGSYVNRGLDGSFFGKDSAQILIRVYGPNLKEIKVAL